MYIAINLNAPSEDLLKRVARRILKDLGVDSWNIDSYCHHMTVCMGKREEFSFLLGKKARLIVTDFAINRDFGVAAFKVDESEGAGFFTNNRTPHITAAVREGNKPYFSNQIKEESWKDLSNFNGICKIELMGQIALNL